MARFAGAIVTAVPWPADAVADFPRFLRIRDSDDVADDFVAGDDGEAVAEHPVLYGGVGVARVEQFTVSMI